MARRVSGNGGGGVVRDKAATVPSATAGNLYALRAPLVQPVTWSKLSGDANLSIAGSMIALAAGMTGGATQSIKVRGLSGNNAVEFTVALTAAGSAPQPLAIDAIPPAATKGTAYSYTPTVTGGFGTRTFALTDVLGQPPALPPGLSFSTSTGAITGTPTHSGFHSGFKLTVTDSSGTAETAMFGVYCLEPASLFAWGARLVSVGDSITSQGAATGLRNFNLHLQSRLAGKLKIQVGSDQGVGGQTMTQIGARIADAWKQNPDVVVIHMGHNDGFAAATTLNTLISRYRTAINAILTNSTAHIYIVTTIPSLVATHDATRRAEFIRQLKVDQTGFYASPANQRLHIVDASPGYDPAINNIQDFGSGIDQRIHPNATGASWMADRAYVVLNNAITDNGGWAGLLPSTRDATELLTNWQLAGTDGTLTNATGTAPSGVTVVNNLGGSSAVAVSRTLLGSGNYSLDIAVTGTPAAANSVTVDLPAITLASFGAGSALRGAARIIAQQAGGGAAIGLRNVAHSLGSGAGGINLGTAGIVSADPNANDRPDPAAALDWTSQTYAKMYWEPLATGYYRITFQFGAVALNSSIRIFLPSVKRSETVAYAAPAYIPTGQSSNYAYNINGTLANASTLSAIVGTIAGGNIYGNITYQWTKNGTSISGATSRQYVPSGFTTGDILGCVATIDNGISPPLVLTLPTRTF